VEVRTLRRQCDLVLLKEVEADGFVFYTNSESAKGGELAENAQAAFVMHWKSLGRQVRARGLIEAVSAEQSDAYFNSRHPQSRAGAIASQQSRPLEGRESLVEATAKIREIEFWADGEHRLHDRFRWSRETPDGDWTIARLHP